VSSPRCCVCLPSLSRRLHPIITASLFSFSYIPTPAFLSPSSVSAQVLWITNNAPTQAGTSSSSSFFLHPRPFSNPLVLHHGLCCIAQIALCITAPWPRIHHPRPLNQSLPASSLPCLNNPFLSFSILFQHLY
jgi:hypothetical protein